MIRVIHGNSTLASFQALQKILSSFDELSVTRMDGSKFELTDLKEALETPSFTGKRAVVLEDLSRNRSSATLNELKKYLAEIPESSELVVYDHKLLPPESPILGFSKNIQVFQERGGLNVFEWTDEVGSRKIKESLEGWEILTKGGEEPEYLFLMLVRQFRLLILLKKGEHPKVPDFVAGKLRGQLKYWSEPALESVYGKLLEIDAQNKTGQRPLEVSMVSFLTGIGSKVTS